MAIIKEALDIVLAADCSPTEHKIFTHFVEGAVDSELAAEYLISRVTPGDTTENLRCFKQEWKALASLMTKKNPISGDSIDLVRRRDGPCCFFTKGKPAAATPVEEAHVIPPSFLQDVESGEVSF